jgi:hypothetical protein
VGRPESVHGTYLRAGHLGSRRSGRVRLRAHSHGGGISAVVGTVNRGRVL